MARDGRLGVIADVRRHAETPASHWSRNAGKRPLLVLVDEHRVGGAALAPRLAELRRRAARAPGPTSPARACRPRASSGRGTGPDCTVPAARPGRGAHSAPWFTGWSGIPFDLDRASIARFDDDAAPGRALAAGRGVVRRDARHRVVGRDEVRESASRPCHRRTPTAASGGGAYAEHLEEFAALDAFDFTFDSLIAMLAAYS